MTDNYRKVAEEILKALSVERLEEYIQGIMHVFEVQETKINEQWEEYLNKSTDEILMYNNIVCKRCNTPIQIGRALEIVYVGEKE